MADSVSSIFYHHESKLSPEDALLRSPTVLIAFLGLWGLNVSIFERLGIDYKEALDDSAGACSSVSSSSVSSVSSSSSLPLALTDASSSSGNSSSLSSSSSSSYSSTTSGLPPPLLASPPPSSIVLLSLLLLLFLNLIQFLWIDVLNGLPLVSVALFYAWTLAVVVLSPKHQATMWVSRDLRRLSAIVADIIIGRSEQGGKRAAAAAVLPGGAGKTRTQGGGAAATSFRDVFVADAMCSVSKVFYDWGILIMLGKRTNCDRGRVGGGGTMAAFFWFLFRCRGARERQLQTRTHRTFTFYRYPLSSSSSSSSSLSLSLSPSPPQPTATRRSTTRLSAPPSSPPSLRLSPF